jgi:phosphomannomutase/phosphoglucomutase
MVRFFSLLSAFSILMILVAGAGIYWIGAGQITQSKHDSVEAVAKGIAFGITAQINLLTDMLEKMAQDPNVVAAVTKANTNQLNTVAAELEKYLPGILSVKLLLPDINDINDNSVIKMGYGDLDMVRETFKKNQLPAIHVENEHDRHLAITRRIMQNDQVVGVILGSFNYEFLNKTVQAANLTNGRLELKQATLVLSAAGEPAHAEQGDDALVKVANTIWELHYQYSGSANYAGLINMIGIIVVPALLVLLVSFMVWRKLSDLLMQDLGSIIKACKDMMTNKLQASYPVRLTEMTSVVSNLVQFKRVMDNEDINVTTHSKVDNSGINEFPDDLDPFV